MSFDKEVKKSDEAVEVKPTAKKEVKMIKVETLVDLPCYHGKRLPKGKVLTIPENAFNKDLMKKI